MKIVQNNKLIHAILSMQFDQYPFIHFDPIKKIYFRRISLLRWSDVVSDANTPLRNNFHLHLHIQIGASSVSCFILIQNVFQITILPGLRYFVRSPFNRCLRCICSTYGDFNFFIRSDTSDRVGMSECIVCVYVCGKEQIITILKYDLYGTQKRQNAE